MSDLHIQGRNEKTRYRVQAYMPGPTGFSTPYDVHHQLEEAARVAFLSGQNKTGVTLRWESWGNGLYAAWNKTLLFDRDRAIKLVTALKEAGCTKITLHTIVTTTLSEDM